MAVKKPAAKKPAAKKPAAKKPAAKGKDNNNGVPSIKYPGDVTAPTVESTQMEGVNFEFTNPNFEIGSVDPLEVLSQEIKAGTVSADQLAERFMTAAEYKMVDPTEIAKQFGDINRDQIGKNAGQANQIALDQLETELKGLQNYVPVTSELKRAQVAQDNIFNQAQRDAQLAASDPNLRADLMAQRERANAMAEGRLLSSIDDRSLEMGIRSRAADMAGAGGFGARSSAARKASELMSIDRRLQLSQYGDQLLTSNIGARNQMLLSPTAYSDAGAQVQIMPSQSAAALAQANLSDANARTLLNPAEALQAEINQQQFESNLAQETAKLNTTLAAERDAQQAQLNLTAGTTNLDASMRAQEFNASSAQQAQTVNAANKLQADLATQDAQLRADMSAAQIRSGEMQAKTQLDWNTQNANAQRRQEATMFNAESKFKADLGNRDTRISVAQFNKNLVFQDQQARRAEAAANARAAMAERGASARAAMSASLQREQMAMQIAEKEKDRAFALSQQAEADKRYREGLQSGQSNANAGAVGTAVSRIPTVINGVQAIGQVVTGISNIINSTSTTSPNQTGAPGTVGNGMSDPDGTAMINY